MSVVDLAYYVPEFKIKVNDVEDSYIREHIVSFKIDELIQSAAQFTIVLIDEFNIKTEKFKWLDHAHLQPGKKISLLVGYVNKTVEVISKGLIKTINTSGFTQNSAPTVTIVGYDATHTMLTKVPEIKDETTTIELTGSKVVKIITDNSTFAPEIESTTEYPTKITMSSSTTYGAILKDRAASIGYEFYSSRNKFYFVNPRKEPSKIHKYEWGRDLIQFVPKINTSNLYTGVYVRTMQPDSEKIIEGRAVIKDEEVFSKNSSEYSGKTASELAKDLYTEKVKEIKDGNFNSNDEAEAKAKAELNILGDTLITATGSVVGNSAIELGHVLELTRLGKQFSGLYFITKISHNITDSGYITQFSARKNVIGA